MAWVVCSGRLRRNSAQPSRRKVFGIRGALSQRSDLSNLSKSNGSGLVHALSDGEALMERKGHHRFHGGDEDSKENSLSVATCATGKDKCW